MTGTSESPMISSGFDVANDESVMFTPVDVHLCMSISDSGSLRDGKGDNACVHVDNEELPRRTTSVNDDINTLAPAGRPLFYSCPIMPTVASKTPRPFSQCHCGICLSVHTLPVTFKTGDMHPQRSLRRKRRMSSLRVRRSQISLRQRPSLLFTEQSPEAHDPAAAPIDCPVVRPLSDVAGGGTNSQPSLTVTVNQVKATQRPRSEPIHPTTSIRVEPPRVKLGHPSRPYYTAIRKDFTSPSPVAASPASNGSPPLDEAPYTPRQDEQVSSASDVHRPSLRQALSYPYTIPSSYPSYSFNSPTGFSLSGETELRMALSVSRKREGQSRRGSLSLTLTRTLSGKSSRKATAEANASVEKQGRKRAQTIPETPGEFKFVERSKGVKGRIQTLGNGIRELFK